MPRKKRYPTRKKEVDPGSNLTVDNDLIKDITKDAGFKYTSNSTENGSDINVENKENSDPLKCDENLDNCRADESSKDGSNQVPEKPHQKKRQRDRQKSRPEQRSDQSENCVKNDVSSTETHNAAHINTSSAAGVVECIPPKYEQFKMLSTRLASFKHDNWLESYPVKPLDLAKAGFFYLGMRDETKCFHCGCGICRWEKGDEPAVEHARWFPNCQHLKLLEGNEFISEIQSIQETIFPEGTKDPEIVQKAKDPVQKKDSSDEKTAKEVIQAYKNIIPESVIKEAIRFIVTNGDKLNELNFQAAISKLTSINDRRPKDFEDKSKSNNVAEKTKVGKLCSNCNLSPKSCALLPCGHTVCETCATGLLVCPTCKRPKENFIRLYLS